MTVRFLGAEERELGPGLAYGFSSDGEPTPDICAVVRETPEGQLVLPFDLEDQDKIVLDHCEALVKLGVVEDGRC